MAPLRWDADGCDETETLANDRTVQGQSHMQLRMCKCARAAPAQKDCERRRVSECARACVRVCVRACVYVCLGVRSPQISRSAPCNQCTLDWDAVTAPQSHMRFVTH